MLVVNCHVGLLYLGAFGYAHNITHIALSIYCLNEMIYFCEQCTHEYHLSFNHVHFPELLEGRDYR